MDGLFMLQTDKKIDILLVEDVPLAREGLRALLEKEAFVGAVYEAWDENSFLSVISNRVVDVTLLDLKLEGTSGLELFKKLGGMKQRSDVIAVTGLEGEEVIINMLKAGLSGAVYKLEGFIEIKKAINNIRLAGGYFSPRIRKVIHDNRHRWDEVRHVDLSQLEKDLLRGIGSGFTLRQVAYILKMSEGYAKKLRTKLLKKIGVSTTVELLIFAYRNGLL